MIKYTISDSNVFFNVTHNHSLCIVYTSEIPVYTLHILRSQRFDPSGHQSNLTLTLNRGPVINGPRIRKLSGVLILSILLSGPSVFDRSVLMSAYIYTAHIWHNMNAMPQTNHRLSTHRVEKYQLDDRYNIHLVSVRLTYMSYTVAHINWHFAMTLS